MSDLPIKSKEEFLGGEFETMDLSELKDKLFIVGVNTVDRNKSKMICSTMHGPYTFSEMLEEVGYMWSTHYHHAKVIIANKNRDAKVQFLDENTVDYIEAKWQDLIMEEFLNGGLEKEWTCRAGIIEEEEHKKEEDATK